MVCGGKCVKGEDVGVVCPKGRGASEDRDVRGGGGGGGEGVYPEGEGGA